jgi:hypothetical protein
MVNGYAIAKEGFGQIAQMAMNFHGSNHGQQRFPAL